MAGKRAKWRARKAALNYQTSFVSEKVKCPYCNSNKIKDTFEPKGSNPDKTYAIICGECNESYYIVIKIKSFVSVVSDFKVKTTEEIKVGTEWPYNIPPKLYQFWQKYINEEEITNCYKWFTPT